MDVFIFEPNLLKSISGEDIQWDLITLQLLYVLATRVLLLTTQKKLLLLCSQQIYETGVLSDYTAECQLLSELSLLVYLCHVAWTSHILICTGSTVNPHDCMQKSHLCASRFYSTCHKFCMCRLVCPKLMR